MELRFLNPDLRPLDGHPTEVLVGNLFEHERPPRGVAGLVNWRLGGRVDRQIKSGFLTGARGEVLLLPGRPRLEAEKVLLFGLGARADFDDAAFDLVAERLLHTLLGLCVRSAVVELPGRHDDALAPELAADRFLAAVAAHGGAFDAFVLVDGLEAQKRIQHHMVEERRRVRRG